jgi:archaellum component FlaC
MTLAQQSTEDLTEAEQELGELEDELEAVSVRLGAFRSRLTQEIAKRVTTEIEAS